MKRIFFTTLCVIIGAYLCLSAQTRIAVYVSGVMSDNYKTLLGDNLVEAFAENDQYIAVNRSDALNSILQKARDIQESGHVDFTQIVSATKEYGESQLCAVDVIAIEDMYIFRASLLDVLTNTVIKTASAEAVKNEIGYTKCLEIAKKLFVRLIPSANKAYSLISEDNKQGTDVDLARRRVEENRMYDISFAEFKHDKTKIQKNCQVAEHYLSVKKDLNLAGTMTTILVGGGGAALFAGLYGDKLAKEGYSMTKDEYNATITAMVCGMVASFVPGIVLFSIAPAYEKKAWKAYRKPYDDAVKDLENARRYQRSASMQLYPTAGYDWAGIGMRVTFN